MAKHYLAFDLGAESGRLMLGSLEGERMTLTELHRFPNVPRRVNGSLQWDMESLFAGLEAGLRQAAGTQLPIASLSTDSWGVDYVLYDERGEMMTPVWHYRDARTAVGVANVRQRVDWETIYTETGIQFMPLNTIYQLAAEPPERLALARRLLLIGDAINEHCCGVARHEQSLASTTQLYDPRNHAWSQLLLEKLDLPEEMFGPIVPAGTRLGRLKPALARKVGLPEIEVIATCSHDTAAAVAAVPANGEHWAYLSSGTWSLMGVECSRPIITDRGRELNFTNEIGFGGSVRLLKNIVGLWLVQECKRDWAQRGDDLDYATLTRLAAEAEPFRAMINPADPRFVSPDGMPAKIAAFCQETGQPAPRIPGEYVRCALESLAMFYRVVLRQIESLTGTRMERLHIVGGGCKNALLNQFTANALQIPVLAGPAEGTALGNVMVQAIALGDLPSLAAARDVVRNSFEVTTFQPTAREEWAAAFVRFEQLISRSPPTAGN